MRPAMTNEYSSSRLCRCSGAASPRGGIGCSTRLKRDSVSAPGMMKRTPMVWSVTDSPSVGPMIVGGLVVGLVGVLSGRWVDRCGRSVGAPGVVDGETPGAICRGAQEAGVLRLEMHGLAVGAGA